MFQKTPIFCLNIQMPITEKKHKMTVASFFLFCFHGTHSAAGLGYFCLSVVLSKPFLVKSDITSVIRSLMTLKKQNA